MMMPWRRFSPSQEDKVHAVLMMCKKTNKAGQKFEQKMNRNCSKQFKQNNLWSNSVTF